MGMPGGMPGDGEDERAAIAISLLESNYVDPFGRRSLDQDLDLVWEAQVPLAALNPDYLVLLAEACAAQVEGYKSEYGDVPFNG